MKERNAADCQFLLFEIVCDIHIERFFYLLPDHFIKLCRSVTLL